MAGPPVDGPRDPWPCVLSLPGAQGGFIGDPTKLARDNMHANSHKPVFLHKSYTLVKNLNGSRK